MDLPTELPAPSDTAAALAAVVALRQAADRLEAAAVQAAVDQGWSWSRIAVELGVTKQAVHKRHARRVSATRSDSDQRTVERGASS